jgi:cysteine-rich repeat protein
MPKAPSNGSLLMLGAFAVILAAGMTVLSPLSLRGQAEGEAICGCPCQIQDVDACVDAGLSFFPDQETCDAFCSPDAGGGGASSAAHSTARSANSASVPPPADLQASVGCTCGESGHSCGVQVINNGPNIAHDISVMLTLQGDIEVVGGSVGPLAVQGGGGFIPVVSASDGGSQIIWGPGGADLAPSGSARTVVMLRPGPGGTGAGDAIEAVSGRPGEDVNGANNSDTASCSANSSSAASSAASAQSSAASAMSSAASVASSVSSVCPACEQACGTPTVVQAPPLRTQALLAQVGGGATCVNNTVTCPTGSIPTCITQPGLAAVWSCSGGVPKCFGGPVQGTLECQAAGNPGIILSTSGPGMAVPVARPDAYSMPANSTLSVLVPGILYNDDRGPNTHFTGAGCGGLQHGFGGIDANPGDPATAGRFYYTPQNGYSGTDNCQYQIASLYSGGGQDSNATTVTITIRPPPPSSSSRSSSVASSTSSLSCQQCIAALCGASSSATSAASSGQSSGGSSSGQGSSGNSSSGGQSSSAPSQCSGVECPLGGNAFCQNQSPPTGCEQLQTPQNNNCFLCGGSCGNRELDYGEECDDGNTVSGDGCDGTCHTDICAP